MTNKGALGLRKQFKEAKDTFAECSTKELKNAILVFSDRSGSTEQAEESQKEYFEDTLYHMFEAGMTLSSRKRVVVKTVGDEVMLTQIIADENVHVGRLLENVIKAAVAFQDYFSDQPVKMCICYCKKVLPLKYKKNGRICTSETMKEIETMFKDFPVSVGDILGSDVNLAARILSIADKHQILIPISTFDILPKKWRKEKKTEWTVKQPKQKKFYIEFDLPMKFQFKGIKQPQKVIHITYNNYTKNSSLSKTAYKFKCLTLFDIVGNPTQRKKDLKEIIERAFPKRSPLIYFIYDRKITYSSEGASPYPENIIAVLFQCRDYEHYRSILSVDFLGQHGTKEVVNSILTTPIVFPKKGKKDWHDESRWDKWKIFHNNKKSGFLCLWRLKDWGDSRDFPRVLVNTLSENNCYLNMISVGYYDNISFHPYNYEDITDIVKNKPSILRKRDALNLWSCDIETNNKLEEW